MQLPIEDLTTAAFAPFGVVIEQPTRPADAGGPGWQWWGDTSLLDEADGPYGIGYLSLELAALRLDWAERHMRCTEALIPIGGACLVYVGPPEHPHEPGRPPELDRFRVFRLRQGQGVVLHKGVWHGAPLAIDHALNVVVLLPQGTGGSDTSVVRFAESVVIRHE